MDLLLPAADPALWTGVNGRSSTGTKSPACVSLAEKPRNDIHGADFAVR